MTCIYFSRCFFRTCELVEFGMCNISRCWDQNKYVSDKVMYKQTKDLNGATFGKTNYDITVWLKKRIVLVDNRFLLISTCNISFELVRFIFVGHALIERSTACAYINM